MKWIQASIRLPLFSYKLISRFIHTQTPMFDFRDWALNNPDKLHLVEWLDESASLPSSSVTGEESGLDKELLMMASWIDKIGVDNTAITRGAAKIKIGSALKRMLEYNPYTHVTGESEAIEKAIIEELQSILSSGVHPEYLPEKINDRIAELKGDKSYT